MADIRKHNRSLTREQALAQSVLSGNTGTVYYTTDSHTIIMNGVEYSKSDLKNLEGYFTDDNAKFNYRSTAGSQSVAGQANGDLATIEALYGDSLVWNQLVHTTSFTNTVVDTGSSRRIQIRYETTSKTTSGWSGGDAADITNIIDNTYYSWCKTAPADTSGNWRIIVNGVTREINVIGTSGWSDGSVIVDAIIPNHVYYIRLHVKTCDSTTVGGVNIDNIQVFDLSLMFGLGKEPTLAEFETFLANYFPRKDYAYNEGEVLSIKSNGIKTVGFNQIDWENYTFGVAAACTFTKNKDGFNVSITSTNAYIGLEGQERQWNPTTFGAIIPVLPNQKYCWSWEGAEICIRAICFDKSKVNPPSGQWGLGINTYKGVPFTIPEGVYYICLRFMLSDLTVGQTYNFSNFNLNLSWSGNRNGEYEEYWSETTPIPITTLEGTKSDGTREVMFPDGLCGIGDVHDEIKGNKAIKRIGRVDLGSLGWTKGIGSRFRAYLSPKAAYWGNTNKPNAIISIAYDVRTPATNFDQVDKSVTIFQQNPMSSVIIVVDSSYTSSTATAFKAAMLGVMFYYELAEPIEYTLDNEFKVDYKVDDYGTEEILPENGTAPTTLPIIADIRYGINAVDTLARLHKDYVSVYPQSFNDEQKEQARKNIGVNDTLDGNSLDFGVVQNGDGSIDLDLDVSTIGGESKQKTVELPVATPNHNGLMSKEDKQSLDLNNTLMRLMVIRDSSVGDGIYRHNLCVSQNASRFIDAGYKPVIYRRMKVKRKFASCGGEKVWKWIPCEEVILTPFETQGQQSAYMKIGVPNLLLRKPSPETIYIKNSDISGSDWSKALGVWNYGSPSYKDDNNHYYTAKDFVIESCPDYIIDYSKSTHHYSQTDSYVYAHHGAARKTLYAGGSALKAFKITLQYGFAFVEDSDITSKRVTDIIPFQLVHTPKSGGVTSANKYARWKFRLR